MKFPDVERAEQLKSKDAKKALTPFAAGAERKKKGKIDQHPKETWNPVIPGYSVPLADSWPAWRQRVAA